MHDNVSQFAFLADTVRKDYGQVLELLTKWRNECKLHPNTQSNIGA
jgi:hypothetical protein